MTPPDNQIDIKDIQAISNLVDKEGYDPEQIITVLNALNAIKRNDAKKKHDEETQPEQPKLFLDKEFIYETRDDVYIYSFSSRDF